MNHDFNLMVSPQDLKALNDIAADNLLSEDMDSLYSRQPQGQVDEILALLIRQRPDILSPVERYVANRNIVRAFARRIIRYVFENAPTTPGPEPQRIRSLLRGFINQNIPLILQGIFVYRIPYNVLLNFIREVIRFTLRNIVTIPPSPPPPDINEIAREIIGALRRDTEVFIRLREFGIPQDQANSIVRTIVLFTLRNIDLGSPPTNLPARISELLNQIERQTDVITDILAYNVSRQDAREIVREIIRFTLRNVYQQ